MISGRSYEAFDDAYIDCLRTLCEQPDFLNLTRGQPSQEVLGMAYRLTRPRERQIRLRCRKPNIVFNFAEAFWYLSGRSDAEFIGFYAPMFRRFADDAGTLAGSGYGGRIFSTASQAANQWDNIVLELTQNPDSRRAVIQIFSADELRERDNLDVACTIALQYFVREGSLHSITYMRSNDAYRGTASDVFSFTFLQEILAHQLDLELGTYSHVSGSYHLYLSDDARAKEVVRQGADLLSTEPFPAMPAGDNWPSIRRVLELEEQLRLGQLLLHGTDFDHLELDWYWQQIVRLFALHSQREIHGTTDLGSLDGLHPLYFALCRNLWAR